MKQRIVSQCPKSFRDKKKQSDCFKCGFQPTQSIATPTQGFSFSKKKCDSKEQEIVFGGLPLEFHATILPTMNGCHFRWINVEEVYRFTDIDGSFAGRFVVEVVCKMCFGYVFLVHASSRGRSIPGKWRHGAPRGSIFQNGAPACQSKYGLFRLMFRSRHFVSVQYSSTQLLLYEH